jgi:Ca-activated chloride channel family protein
MIISPIIPIWVLILLFIVSIVFFTQRKPKNIILTCVIFAFLFLIDIRIKNTNGIAKTSSCNLDILFAIDTSLSMVAEDYNGNERRLDAVIDDCQEIVDSFPGGKYSLIIFDDRARVVSPFTTDGNVITSYLRGIGIPLAFYAKGSSINSSYEAIYDMLSNYESEETRKKILIYISDGEITNEEKLTSFSKLNGCSDYAAILGYGTKARWKDDYIRIFL